MSKSVQVWQIPLEVSEKTLQTYENCLSVDERSRADRFHFPDDRRRFIVARGTLRHLLGRQFSRLPQAIEFCYGEYGKPGVVPDKSTVSDTKDSCDFHFNLSHSGELALCALGGQNQVGIDIEKFKPIQRLDSMIERCLSEKELARVGNEPDPTRAFLKFWTCKEAYLKAIGLGLSQPMQTVEVEMAPPKFVRIPKDCADGWHLHYIDVPEPYVSALVTEGKTSISIHYWQHELLGEEN